MGRPELILSMMAALDRSLGGDLGRLRLGAGRVRVNGGIIFRRLLRDCLLSMASFFIPLLASMEKEVLGPGSFY